MNQTRQATAGGAEARPYRVLACLDFTDLGDRTVVEALDLCGAHGAAELHVLIVAAVHGDELELPGPERRILPRDEAEEAGRRRVAGIIEGYLGRGGRIEMEKVAIYLEQGDPAERILAVASALDADLIVLGTHGRRGLSRVLAGGSTAETVMRNAPCGVFVIRPRDFLDGEKIPEVEPPLSPEQHPLLPFRHRHHYHYVDRVSRVSERIMPAI